MTTTNAILLLLAIASVVQTALVVGIAIATTRAYREFARLVETQVSPTLLRLEGVLTNLEHTSAVVRTRTDDMSRAFDSARQTASHLGAAVWPRAAVVASVAGGVISAIKGWRATRRTRPDITIKAG